MAYSLDNPHPDHQPRVGRVQIGKTPIRPPRPVYGTTLRCSCGYPPGSKSRVSNLAPSKGGRNVAQFLYRRHLTEAGLT